MPLRGGGGGRGEGQEGEPRDALGAPSSALREGREQRDQLNKWSVMCAQGVESHLGESAPFIYSQRRHLLQRGEARGKGRLLSTSLLS